MDRHKNSARPRSREQRRSPDWWWNAKSILGHVGGIAMVRAGLLCSSISICVRLQVWVHDLPARTASILRWSCVIVLRPQERSPIRAMSIAPVDPWRWSKARGQQVNFTFECATKGCLYCDLIITRLTMGRVKGSCSSLKMELVKRCNELRGEWLELYKMNICVSVSRSNVYDT